jgi:hypothetical protein
MNTPKYKRIKAPNKSNSTYRNPYNHPYLRQKYSMFIKNSPCSKGNNCATTLDEMLRGRGCRCSSLPTRCKRT